MSVINYISKRLNNYKTNKYNKQTNLKQMATPDEQAIQGVIDQIWDTYDVKKSGALDK